MNLIKKIFAWIKSLFQSPAKAGNATKQVADRPTVIGHAPSLALTTPWVLHVNKLTALFLSDPEISVDYDNDNKICDIRVANDDKYWAMKALMPHEKKWGETTLRIRVLPADDVIPAVLPTDPREMVKRVFAGNPSVADIVDIEGIATNDFTFVVFRPEVVQYYSDDLGDIHGLTSTLRANLCKELLQDQTPGVFYCTDKLPDQRTLSSIYLVYSAEDSSAPAEDQAGD